MNILLDIRYFLYTDVYGTEVRVFDEHLCEAIKALGERQRNIVLMSYFLEMSDIEIGQIIGISRCSVYRSRMRALNIVIKKICGGIEKWNVYKNVHDLQLSVQQ